jgi:hypothetical protein
MEGRGEEGREKVKKKKKEENQNRIVACLELRKVR